ncbi:MAG: hypothetical protein FWD70_06420 [Desulfuromonadales bacterium]|nr:hypothetical protein [Desulfuromonadales bacterium]
MKQWSLSGIIYLIRIIVSVVLFLFGFVLIVINQMTDDVHTYFFGSKGTIGGICTAVGVLLFLFTLSAIARANERGKGVSRAAQNDLIKQALKNDLKLNLKGNADNDKLYEFLKSRGVTGTAAITDSNCHLHPSEKYGRLFYVYALTISFADIEGKNYTPKITYQIEGVYVSNFMKGKTIPILYDANDPNSVAIDVDKYPVVQIDYREA